MGIAVLHAILVLPFPDAVCRSQPAGAQPDKPPADPTLPKCLSNEQAGVYR